MLCLQYELTKSEKCLFAFQYFIYLFIHSFIYYVLPTAQNILNCWFSAHIATELIPLHSILMSSNMETDDGCWSTFTFMHLADSFIQSDLQRRIRYLLGFKEVIKSSYTVFKGKNNKTIL